MADVNEVDAVYAERNAVVLAFAQAASCLGATVGKLVDPEEPGWPVLVIDTPYGQCSWHMRADEMPEGMPDYPGSWDGHTSEEKHERLATLVRMHEWPPSGAKAWPRA